MRNRILYFILTGYLILACENQPPKTDSVDFKVLSGSEYVFVTDRVVMHPEVSFPSDTLKESDYTKSGTLTSYNISFSDDGSTITISDTISGSRTNQGNIIKYDITDDLFAGGRFMVWKNGDHFEAEFTIYGSGVPIIRSERGILYAGVEPV